MNRFDLLVSSGERASLPLAAALAAELELLRAPRFPLCPFDPERRPPEPDVGRLAILAAVTRNVPLWQDLVAFLLWTDDWHRIRQREDGMAEEKLGPWATPERAAGLLDGEAQAALARLPAAVGGPLAKAIDAWRRGPPPNPALVHPVSVPPGD